MKFAVLDVTHEDPRFLHIAEGALLKIACLDIMSWLQLTHEINNKKDDMNFHYGENKVPHLNVNNGEFVLKIIPLEELGLDV